MSPTESSRKELTLEDVLVSYPPGSQYDIVALALEVGQLYQRPFRISLRRIQLHCDNESCGGIRFFDPASESFDVRVNSSEHRFSSYTCSNCNKTVKHFSYIYTLKEKQKATVLKLGEWPLFGPPIPSRLVSLIGPDRDYFLKGYRAENQNLGIGAYAYYRRVVENQKDRIFDEIIRAAERTNLKKDIIDNLKDAKAQPHFSQAVEALKGAFPDILLLNGHNPLALLHSALSEGLHNGTDEECLELASTIRLLLTELADRLGQVLKEQSKLELAVSKLLKHKPSK